MPVLFATHLAAASPSLNALLEGPQKSAVIAGMIVAGLLYLTILAAAIVIVVRAFRTSVVWGLVVLLVPFGIIVFVATHWQETMKPFLLQLACGGVIGAFVAFAVLGKGLRPPESAANAPGAKPTPHEVRDLAEYETPASATPPPDSNTAQRAAYAKHAKELTSLYQGLNAERPKLKPGSPAVAAFNAKAARYQQGLQTLAEEKTRLDALDHARDANAEAAAALASLRTSAATDDYEAFAATLKKSLSDYRQTPVFPQLVAFARPVLQQATPDKVLAGLQGKAGGAARAEFDRTTRKVQGIVNQTPQMVTPPPGSTEIYKYGFHPGANKPDYNATNLIGTRELWKGEYVYMDGAPNVFYRAADCEFNPQTKYFYLSRTVAKKRLSDAEYAELTRLYHLLGEQEKALANAPSPAADAERVSGDLATLKAQLDGYAMK